MFENEKNEETMGEKDDALLKVVAELPQYDVPEQVTQRIMASVEKAEASRPKSVGLLAPVAVVAAFGMCTVLPVDSVEGMLSTGVSLGALYLVQLLIRSAKTEEMAI